MRWRGHYEEPMILNGGSWGQGPGHRGQLPPCHHSGAAHAEQYSRCGLTVDLYRGIRLFGFLNFIIL